METAAPDSRIVYGYRLAAQVIGWVVLGGGLVVLVVGWWLEVVLVRAPIPGAQTMVANTAFAFALTGLSLVLYFRSRSRVAAVASACLAIVLGIVNLAEYLVGAHATRFDTLLAADPAPLRPGRMSVLTAVCFVFAGVALVLLLLGRLPGLRQGMGVVVAVIALSGILGYLLGNDYLIGWSPAFTPIAINTAILMFPLGSAIIMAEPNVGWARVIASPYAGGRLFRLVILPLFVIVLATSFVADYFRDDFGSGDDPVGVGLSQVSWVVMTVLLVGLLFLASLTNDNSDQKRQTATEELAASEHGFRTLAENATDVVWQLDTDDVMLWVSPSVKDELGWEPGELVGTNLRDLIHPDDWDDRARWKAKLLPGASVPNLESRRKCADGSYRWMSLQGRTIANPDGSVSGLIVGMRSIEGEVRARSALAHAIEHDPLTGLATLPVALARLDRLLEELDESADDPSVGVLCIGIDSLKPVNEALTYTAGDQVITEIAIRIASVVGDPDLLARGDGDWFLVLAPKLISGADAGVIAEQIHQATRGAITIGDNQLDPTTSIGIATAGADTNAGEAVRDAALAMHQAKDHGRDRWEFFDDQVGHEARQRVFIEARIREGLADGQFVPWFQPIVNLDDGVVVGYEALVRWVRPSGTVIAPDDFLGVAEITSLISEIDLAVLPQSLEVAAKLPSSVTMAINISAATLASSDYAAQVADSLLRSGVDADRLHIEFTETALLNVSDQVHAVMDLLAGAGVRWYVDDFGTGFSSISHLRDLPIAGLKLDMSFTHGLGSEDQTSDRLAQALSALANSLELDTVAEGVETPEQAAILKAQGWRHGQGWLYGHPEPASAILPP